jgi:quercetin dioxygenase-like cupin family protein
MKIDRWTADLAPNRDIIANILVNEGLDLTEVPVPSAKKVANKRTTMTEVIVITAGELIFNLSGTQFVLRLGDRLEIAPNTLFSYSNMRDEPASFLLATKL